MVGLDSEGRLLVEPKKRKPRKMPKIRGSMNPKKFIEYRDQVVAGGRKQTIGRVTNLPHEDQPAFIADSPTRRALWRLSLVLKEISENLESHSDLETSLYCAPLFPPYVPETYPDGSSKCVLATPATTYF